MKTIKYTFLGLVFVGLMSSCEEDLINSQVEIQQALAENYVDAEAALSNIYTIVDLTARNPNVIAGDTVPTLGAAVYTTGTTINIDYGNGATGPDGVTRSGIIKVDQTGDYNTNGGKLDVSFENYMVDGNPVGGKFNVVNQGNLTFTLNTTENFYVNRKFNLNVNKSLTWTGGFNTNSDEQDDEYTLSGTSVGTDSTNHTLTASIDPLEAMSFSRDCEYAILGGIIDLTFAGDSLDGTTGNIDFLLDDGCDNLVKLKVVDGEMEVETFINIDGFGL